MPITYKDGATDRTPTAVYYQDGATLRTITEVWIGDGGNRKVFGAGAPGATHTVSVTDISDSGATPGPVGGSSTATVTGGVGPFTYSWSWIGSGPAGVSLSGSTTATATISWTSEIAGDRVTTLRCTVTDTGNGSATANDDASVNLVLT